LGKKDAKKSEGGGPQLAGSRGSAREGVGGPVTLRIRVRPRAAADRIEADSAAREVIVSVTAPAVEGKANRAMLAQLADHLGVSRSSLQIVSGEKSRRKVVRVHGLGEAELWRRLAGR
jgi:uncharacterized protein (TIGR00251 family)